MATRDGIAFDRLCTFAQLPAPVAEYQFAPPRRWRFDWAWPGQKVALEVEGGVFMHGRHTRAAGYLMDMQKYNRAAVLGWIVLRCVPRTLGKSETLTLVRQALATRIELP